MAGLRSASPQGQAGRLAYSIGTMNRVLGAPISWSARSGHASPRRAGARRSGSWKGYARSREPSSGLLRKCSTATRLEHKNRASREMKFFIVPILTVSAACWVSLGADDVQPPPQRLKPHGSLKLKLRSRVETFKGSGVWDAVNVTREVPIAEVAIVICDMWDKHWCDGATTRCDALAGRMAPVIQAARARGIQIVHAPSETMNF